MEVLHPRCAGLDVHRDTVVACARIAAGDVVQREVETFGTTTEQLFQLSEWLSARGVTHVAMEATGVYWRPVWHVLQQGFTLILANASHVKNVPGRKTDVNDATWLAELLAHGLIRSSFVPPPPVQALRSLTRTRKQLVRERASHVQRIDKTLQDANIKLGSVLSDIMGTSGRAILEAIAAGESDPEALAALVTTRVRAPRAEIARALQGSATETHRFLLRLHLQQITSLDEALKAVDRQIGDAMRPFRDAAAHLSTAPGVAMTAASAIVSEIGTDMSRFPSPQHLVSWAGLSPRNDESAGKRRSTRVRPGAPWLKTMLVQCAWCATRAKGSYLRAKFLRIRARRGPRKAILAVAAALTRAFWFMLKHGAEWRDLGPDYFTRTERTKIATRLVRRLADMGFSVTLAENPDASSAAVSS
ncbi:MAG TPA: IS110 family transposase [Candidatus Tectomicrobia bacterium]|nr:IS110 family transposase [Candidatus Tectomicrobia bacterium]